MKIEVSKSLYQADIVRAVLYKYLKENIHVEEDEYYWFLYLTDANDTDLTKRKILDDILDEQLRYELEIKVGKVREIIVEHAFKPINNLNQGIDKRGI